MARSGITLIIVDVRCGSEVGQRWAKNPKTLCGSEVGRFAGQRLMLAAGVAVRGASYGVFWCTLILLPSSLTPGAQAAVQVKCRPLNILGVCHFAGRGLLLSAGLAVTAICNVPWSAVMLS